MSAAHLWSPPLTGLTPPVPPPTYLWEEVRRRRIRGGYPWTWLGDRFRRARSEPPEHEYEPISPGPVLVSGPDTKREPVSSEQINLTATEMQRRLEDAYLGGSAGGTAASAGVDATGGASTENQENVPPANTSIPEFKVTSPEEVEAEDEKAATAAKHAGGVRPRLVRVSQRGMEHIRSGADKIKTKFRSISLPARPTVSLPRSLQRARQSKSGERKGPLRVGKPADEEGAAKEPTATAKFMENIRTYPRMLEKRFARSTPKKAEPTDQEEPMDTTPATEGTHTEAQETKKTFDFDFRTYPRMIGKRIQRMTSRQEPEQPEDEAGQTEPKTTKRKFEFDFSTYPRALERRIRRGISRQPRPEPEISPPITTETIQPNGTSTPTETPGATLEQNASPPTEAEVKTTKKIFDFDFRTYPRIFERKRQHEPEIEITPASPEVVEVASPGRPLTAPTQVSDYPGKGKRFMDFDFRTYPRLIQKKLRKTYATSSPKTRQRAKNIPPLPPRRKGPVGSRWVNRFDDIRYADDEEVEIECGSGGTESSAAFHDKDYGYAVTLPPRPTDERYGRAGSEDEERWGRHGSQSGGSAADADAESSDGSRRRGVLEEIDSDEFFLRQKGISQEDLQGGNSLNTQIRDALSDLGQQYRATPERIAPPARPARKSAGEQVVFGTFPPNRPRREKKGPRSITPRYEDAEAGGENEGPPLPPKRDRRTIKRRDFATLHGGERRWSLGYDDEESWMKDIESQILPADSPLLAVARAEPRYNIPGEALPVGETPPIPPKRGRRRQEYDEDEPGYAHISRREEEESLQREGDVMVNGDLDDQEYEDEKEVDDRPKPPQRVKPPRPPPPAIKARRRRRTAEDGVVSKESDKKAAPFSYFFSMPRKAPRTYYIVTPPTRPRRNYSTVRPLRPPRHSRAKPRHHSTGALDMIGINGSLQDANGSSRDLQSDDVIEKMKGRPLPAPPRPPRRTKDEYEDAVEIEDFPVKAQITQESLAGAGSSSLPLGGIEKLVTELDAALLDEPAAGAFSDEIFYRQRESQELLPQAEDGAPIIPIQPGATPPRKATPTPPRRATPTPPPPRRATPTLPAQPTIVGETSPVRKGSPVYPAQDVSSIQPIPPRKTTPPQPVSSISSEPSPPRKITPPQPVSSISSEPSPPQKITPPQPVSSISSEPSPPRKISPQKLAEILQFTDIEPSAARIEDLRQLEPTTIETEESERAPELPKRSPSLPKPVEPEIALITEVSIATQTDPLPDDVCVEDDGEIISIIDESVPRPASPTFVTPTSLPEAPTSTPYTEPESRPPLQQPIFTLPEPFAALMSLSASSEIQAPRLRLADLDVDRLNVGELKAQKISVSEIEGMCLHVSELSSQAGQLVVTSLSSLTPVSAPQPIPPPVQQPLVTSVPSTSHAPHSSLPTNSSTESERPSNSMGASSSLLPPNTSTSTSQASEHSRPSNLGTESSLSSPISEEQVVSTSEIQIPSPQNLEPSEIQIHSSSGNQSPASSNSGPSQSQTISPSSEVQALGSPILESISALQSPSNSSSPLQVSEPVSPEPVSNLSSPTPRDQTASPEEITIRPSNYDISSSSESLTLRGRIDNLISEPVSPSLSSLSISESLGSSRSIASSDDPRGSSTPVTQSREDLYETKASPIPKPPEPLISTYAAPFDAYELKTTKRATPTSTTPDDPNLSFSAQNTSILEVTTSTSSISKQSTSESGMSSNNIQSSSAAQVSTTHDSCRGSASVSLAEASLPELGQQLVRATGAATIRAVRALLESALGRVRPGDPQPHPGELQLAMVVLLVVVAGLLLLSGGSTTHHHWDFYFPP